MKFMGGVRSLVQKRKNRGHFVPKGQEIRIFLIGVKPNWPRLSNFCLIAGVKPDSKNSIWIFKLNSKN